MWCPSAGGLCGHGQPWQILQDHHATARHGNLQEGHLIVGKGKEHVNEESNTEEKAKGKALMVI